MDERRMRFDDLRHVAELQPVAVLDRHLSEVRARPEGQHVLDRQSLVRPLDEAAAPRGRRFEERERGDQLGVAGGLDDLGEREAVLPQAVRIDLHLQLAIAQAPDRHVCDAGQSQEPRPDG